jgi:hypothetical protein
LSGNSGAKINYTVLTPKEFGSRRARKDAFLEDVWHNKRVSLIGPMKKLKSHTVDWAQVDRFLASAGKKLASARKILAFDEEACLQPAYEQC